MRIVALVFAVSALSLWLGLHVDTAKGVSALPAQAAERGPVTANIDDSDLFFQSTIRAAGPQRDNSQKIEALLKRLTLEEKVGQMTQLAIGMKLFRYDEVLTLALAILALVTLVDLVGQLARARILDAPSVTNYTPLE